MSSVTAVNCCLAHARPCKCYANCESYRRPALTIRWKLKNGTLSSLTALGRQIVSLCSLKQRWIHTSACQNLRRLASCHFQVLLTRNKDVAVFAVVVPSTITMVHLRGCLVGISTYCVHAYFVHPLSKLNKDRKMENFEATAVRICKRPGLPLLCLVYKIDEILVGVIILILCPLPSDWLAVRAPLVSRHIGVGDVCQRNWWLACSRSLGASRELASTGNSSRGQARWCLSKTFLFCCLWPHSLEYDCMICCVCWHHWHQNKTCRS